MKAPKSQTRHFRQRGVVSVLAALVLVMVVLVILAQSVKMSGTNALGAQQYADTARARALAESGIELAIAQIGNTFAGNDSGSDSCKFGGLPASGDLGVTPGSVSFISASVDPITSDCKVRVKGSFNKANTTLESRINFKVEIGTGDFGHSPSLTLTNPYSVPAVAVFNLAWGLKRSSGHSTTGNDTTAAPSCPGCVARWNLKSAGGGNNAVGSMGTSMPIGATAPDNTATFSETLTDDRNYVQVGLILGGYAGSPPTYINYFADKNITGNTSSALVTTGDIPTGPSTTGGSPWCATADTLVFGVSGVGPYQANPPPPAYDYSATFNDVWINIDPKVPPGPEKKIRMTKAAHYPNTDGSSPKTAGDVFSEIWWTYNPYVANITASGPSVGKKITVSNTNGLKIGTVVKVFSGTGEFLGGTKVDGPPNQPAPTATEFYVDQPITTALGSGDVICSGLCALFQAPSTKNSTTTLTISRSTTAATEQQYVGGLVCYSGVDPTKVKRVGSSGINTHMWHEVVTGE